MIGPAVPDPGGEPLLRLTGVVKTFPGVRALDGVDLAVAEGEVHCLLGQNGGGKSTFIKVLAGVHRPDGGQMWWAGQQVEFASSHAAMRAGIATIYQELDLVDELAGAENILLGHEPHAAGFVRRGPAHQEAAGILATPGHPEIPVGRLVGKDAPAQIAALQTLIQQKPDVLVLLPQDGAQLTATGKAAMSAGIPVVNLHREFSDAGAARLLIKTDNYGMGLAAGRYIGAKLKGRTNAVIAEVAGIDNLPLTQDRSRGFRDGLAQYGLKVSNRVAAQFTVQSGQNVTANLLQAAPKIDALWNHDDDQGVGVLAAIKQAGRKEFFMVGGAGSLDAMEHLRAGDTPLEATVTYPPTMASSAISVARLVAQGKGLSDLVELQVPKEIVLASETVTNDNVDKYLPLGFRS